MTTKPFFSIIIPTLNEEKYLPDLLTDLSKQSYTNFEVIHVDGASEDKTVELAKSFKKKINISTYTAKKRNVSFQRNLGIKKANGNWLVFMDADNRLASEFLDGIRYRLAQKPETDLFTTWVKTDSNNSLNPPIERTINFALELGKMVGKEWSFGALIGVRSNILSSEFYFDETQKVGEDGIFVKTLSEQGFNFSIFRDPRYTYSVRRLDAEGTLKMTSTVSKLALNYFQGKDFSEHDFGYKMEGGAAYTADSLFSTSRLYNFIKTSTSIQLKQARDLFNSLTRTKSDL